MRQEMEEDMAREAGTHPQQIEDNLIFDMRMALREYQRHVAETTTPEEVEKQTLGKIKKGNEF
jgi:hypothetical protein